MTTATTGGAQHEDCAPPQPQCTRDPACPRPPRRRGMCHAHYEQWRTRQHAYGRFTSEYVDAEPVRIHIKNLTAAGLGSRRIAELAGVNRKTIQWITTGRSERGTGPSTQMLAANAAKILAVPVPDTPHQAAASRANVPAIGTVRRLQALVASGYPRSYLAARLGIRNSNATHLFRSDTTHVLADTARRVETLFAELHVTPGHSARARNEGRRSGWPLPMAWDEDTIDNPNGAPSTAVDERATFVDRYRELREDLGISDREIAKRLGIKLVSLVKNLERASLPISPELRTLAWEERYANQKVS